MKSNNYKFGLFAYRLSNPVRLRSLEAESMYRSLFVSVGVICSILGGGLLRGFGSPQNLFASNVQGPVPGQEMKSRLALTLPADSFLIGQPIDFDTVVHNSSSESLTIWSCGYTPNHLVILMAEDGMEPDLTAEGRQSKLAFFSMNRDKNYPVKVAPGKLLNEGKHRLTDLFSIKPGLYQMKVLYSDSQDDTREAIHARKELSLLSNVAKFRVIDGEKGQKPHL